MNPHQAMILARMHGLPPPPRVYVGAKRGRPQGATGPAGDIKARERLFLIGLLMGKCKRAAAIHAGYSPSSARNTATQLLRRPRVRAVLAAYHARHTDRLSAELEQRHAEREQLRQQLLETITTNVTDAFTNDWRLRPRSEIPPAVLRQITYVNTTRRGTFVRFKSRTQAFKEYARLFLKPERKRPGWATDAECRRVEPSPPAPRQQLLEPIPEPSTLGTFEYWLAVADAFGLAVPEDAAEELEPAIK